MDKFLVKTPTSDWNTVFEYLIKKKKQIQQYVIIVNFIFK